MPMGTTANRRIRAIALPLLAAIVLAGCALPGGPEPPTRAQWGVARDEIAPVPTFRLVDAVEALLDELAAEAIVSNIPEGANFVRGARRTAAQNLTWDLEAEIANTGVQIGARRWWEDENATRERAEQLPAIRDDFLRISDEIDRTRASLSEGALAALVAPESFFIRQLLTEVPDSHKFEAAGATFQAAGSAEELEVTARGIRALTAAAANASQEAYAPPPESVLWARVRALEHAFGGDPTGNYRLVLDERGTVYRDRARLCLEWGWLECAHAFLLESESAARSLEGRFLQDYPSAPTKTDALATARARAAESSVFQLVYSYAHAVASDGDYLHDQRFEDAAADVVLGLATEPGWE